MNLEDIKEMDLETLTTTIVGQVLGCAPYSITLQARECPEKLRFPTICVGNRTLIPRRAFIKFMEGELEEE